MFHGKRIDFPGAGHFVGERESNHDAEPEEGADDGDSREAFLIFHVHEEEDDEQTFW